MSKTILILGGSFAGVATAHRLLQTTLKTADYKIVLVSQSTHVYWNIAAPRAVIPGQVPDQKVFQPIAPGFKDYAADKFSFVLGTAEQLDVEGKKVIVAAEGGQREIGYDILILATGSKANDGMPWKLAGSYEATRDALHEMQEKVKTAKSIVVVGAGTTGVETAGELSFEYGKTKKITLVSTPLSLSPPYTPSFGITN